MNDQDSGDETVNEPNAPAGDEEKARWQDLDGLNPFRDRQIEDPELYRGLDSAEELQKEIERSDRSYWAERRLREKAADASDEMFDAPESVIPELEEFVVDPWGGPGPDTPDADPPASETPTGPTPTGSDDGDLPGLESDYAEEEAAPDAEPSHVEALAPTFGDGKWTNAEIDQWFENEFGGDAALQADWEILLRTRDPDRIMSTLLDDLEWLEETDGTGVSELDIVANALLAGEGGFKRLHPRIKGKFRDFVEANTETIAGMRAIRDATDETTGAPVEKSRSGMSAGAVVGSVLAGLALIIFVSWFLTRDGGGGDPEAAPEPTTASDADTEDPGESTTAPADVRDAAAETSAQTWTVVDVEGNWLPFDEFDEIAPDREADGLLAADALAAADVTGVDVVSDGSSATIGINHAGDAESIQAHERATYRVGVIWVTPNGRTVEVLYHDDGTVKISDALTDWSVEAFWESSERLLIAVDGVGVVPGNVVAATVFLELFDGVNLQAVEVPTG